MDLIFKKAGILLLVFGLFVSSACQRTSDLNENEVATGTFLNYMALDSTLLEVTEVASGLEIPWDIDIDKTSKLWYTEQKGTVSQLDLNTLESKLMLTIPEVYYNKSYGLLGMTLHPEFPDQPFLFLHYTYRVQEDQLQQSIQSRIVRYTFQDDSLVNPKTLLDQIPGNTYHNGSRLAVSPDKKLYFSMGDAGRQQFAQNTDHLSGKILRLNLDGTIPDDNPIPGSPIWSKGHRNPQGLAFSDDGTLYSSEHGPNTDDEINRITKNGNYGWPDVHGFCDEGIEIRHCQEHNIQEPMKAWTPTIAASGLGLYSHTKIPEWQNSLILGNLKGRALRVLSLSASGEKIVNEQIYFQQKFGRIRDVDISTNGDVYFSTSNTDWHPKLQPWMYENLPTKGEDRVIRIRPSKLTITEAQSKDQLVLYENEESIPLSAENWTFTASEETVNAGKKLYLQHCSSCHAPDGKGAQNLTPPLVDTDWVTGDKGRLIRVVLNGLSGPIRVNEKTYNQEMAGFSRILSDEEIASILTYIRGNMGNNAGPVIPGEVSIERIALEHN